MNLSYLLSDGLQADWITTVFPILRYVFIGIILACSVIMIVTVILQSDENVAGSSAISGVQESYYSQNKGESRDGKLKKTTTIMAIIIAVCVVLYFVTLLINKS